MLLSYFPCVLKREKKRKGKQLRERTRSIRSERREKFVVGWLVSWFVRVALGRWVVVYGVDGMGWVCEVGGC